METQTGFWLEELKERWDALEKPVQIRMSEVAIRMKRGVSAEEKYRALGILKPDEIMLHPDEADLATAYKKGFCYGLDIVAKKGIEHPDSWDWNDAEDAGYGDSHEELWDAFMEGNGFGQWVNGKNRCDFPASLDADTGALPYGITKQDLKDALAEFDRAMEVRWPGEGYLGHKRGRWQPDDDDLREWEVVVAEKEGLKMPAGEDVPF